MARHFTLCTLLTLAFIGSAQPSGEPVQPETYVLLWFDTEDYLLPASDDALLRLCTFLSDQNIRATFKIVGEKARVLEKRGRRDVLDALSLHEVGYHTDFHSVQPSPAMYLSPLGWFEGVEEFDRREGKGLRDVERITGQHPSCYGQPGSSWGPQQFGGLHKWDVPVYLDAGDHIGLDGRPLWYAGILTLYNLRDTLRTELETPEDVEEARDDFREAHALLHKEGGGVVSIYYHPCEFVHAEFWDAVNFLNGANPPPSQWKIPPRKTPEAIEQSFKNFEEYIRFIQSMPGTRFITASDALELYPDRSRKKVFRPAELLAIAKGIGPEGITHHVAGDFSLAPSEQLKLLSRYLSDRLSSKQPQGSELTETPLGPVRPAPVQREVRVDRSQFARTVAEVADYLESEHRVPDAVWLGSSVVSPESFLEAVAGAVVALEAEGEIPEEVALRRVPLASARHIRNDPGLWGWVIFPHGFEAPEMMELARRQAWTLKPALLAGAPRVE